MEKNVLITGVSRGLGLHIALTLLHQGWTVYGVSRTQTEAVKDLEQQFQGRFHFKSFDLEDCDSVHEQIFKQWITHAIPLHGFVNNAAIAYDDIITNLQQKALEQMFRVNVFTPFQITKYAIRNMIFNRIRGSMVHISSISVHTGYKGLAMYASSKGALEAFSKNTAREWGERGIRSNALIAGFMDTDMSAKLPDDMKNRIYQRTSLKQPTTPESVAATVAFLLSDDAHSITGQGIFVDSGTI